jgi:hypothetical protein
MYATTFQAVNSVSLPAMACETPAKPRNTREADLVARLKAGEQVTLVAREFLQLLQARPKSASNATCLPIPMTVRLAVPLVAQNHRNFRDAQLENASDESQRIPRLRLGSIHEMRRWCCPKRVGSTDKIKLFFRTRAVKRAKRAAL